MEDIKFTHLHVHTQYSLLDGACKLPELVARAKELNMDALAITDHGVMFGVIDFYRECLKQGIKPILGVEAYVINGDIFDKTLGRDEVRYHLILLAENNEGYQNLIKLVSESQVNGMYYKPRMSKEMLRKYHKGIIALSACIQGEVAQSIMMDNYEKAKNIALEYQDIFGKDNFFLEMQCNELDEQIKVNEQLAMISKETGIGLVVTNDVHYVNYEDYEIQDILMCIQTGKKVQDVNRMRMPYNDFYLKDKNEIYQMFKEHLDALENTHKISDRCNVEIEFGNLKLPKFKTPNDSPSKEYLRELCNEGIEKKYKDVTKALRERLDYELSIIENMGYVDYFLIVWDFIKYAKDNGIPVGPGRGSAAGSIVSYVLNITEVDPMKYDLIFERFLNPERVSMPDIDIDFCYERRQEVIDYVVSKYGKDSVVQIVTFGTMGAKAVIRDVGRVLDMPYSDVNNIAKMIPFATKMTIDTALELNKEFSDLYKSDMNARYLIDIARKLEGLPRHTSIHAAGVVITENPVSDYVPLAKSEESVVTQFNMTTIEELGLLKMDFLGLRTLTVIKNTVQAIKKNYGVCIDIKNIDFNDQDVYRMISKGKTSAIFQLESDGMTSFLKELEPVSIEDIIAAISLYRPGPMDFIPAYIEGRKNPTEIKYDNELIESILKPTYGTIVYQEQVMEIFRKLAGYSLGRSDLVRRAMSKKKMDVMLREKEIFINGLPDEGIEGAIKRGISKESAEKVYNQMVDFAKYAFNKSHSACYAYVAYQTAYLKCHYPAELYAATISSLMDVQAKVSSYIDDAKELGIEVLPPDINESEVFFNAKNNRIRFALSAIKGVGMDIITKLVYEREQNGQFISLTDFIERMLKYNISKRAIENLIKVGAFDSLGAKRSQYLAIYINVFDKLQTKLRGSMEGQIDLFSLDQSEENSMKEDIFPELNEISERARLMMEKDLLGIYVSSHPLKEYDHLIAKYANYNLGELTKQDEETDEYVMSDEVKVTVFGIVESIKLKITKSNTMMAFVTLVDSFSKIQIVVFPKVYDMFRTKIIEGEIICVDGRTSIREDDGCTILVSSIRSIDEMVSLYSSEKRLFIEISDLKDQELMHNLERVFKLFPGEHKIEILVRSDMKPRTPKLKIEINDTLLSELEKINGVSNIKVIE